MIKASGVALAVAFLPLLAFAQTTGTQSQVQTLQQEIVQLQQEIADLSAQPQVSNVSASSNCAVPTHDLSFGESDSNAGGDVTVLQQFLVARGYLPAGDVTGFFGHATQAAVVQFQGAHSIEQTGYVGPLTLAAIGAVCSGTSASPPSSGFSASPSSGNAPLSVTFTAAEAESPQSGSSYVVDFGDGNRAAMSEDSASTFAVSHTYAGGGTFNAILYLEQNLCGGTQTYGCVSDLQVGAASVVVSGNTTTSSSGGSCAAPPDGRVYSNGQTANYSDWCSAGYGTVYCGSGVKLCQNGQWVSTTQANTTPAPSTSGDSCVAWQTTYANGATIWYIGQPGPNVLQPLGQFASQWTCSSGEWVPAN